MVPILGYWARRGRAEPIRYILQYAGINYVEENYYIGPPPEYSKSNWRDIRFTKGFCFPNLPYYIDGDVKVTQSIAIMRYLGRKHGLIAAPENAVLQDVVEQQTVDFREQLAQLCYDVSFEERKHEYIKNLPMKLKMFSDFLGEKQWMMGSKLTYVDFFLYEVFDVHKFLEPNCLEAFSNLMAYVSSFENLPAIYKYRNSEAFRKWPIFGPTAYFAGK